MRSRRIPIATRWRFPPEAESCHSDPRCLRVRNLLSAGTKLPSTFHPKRKTRPPRAAPISTTIKTMSHPLRQKQYPTANKSPQIPILGIHETPRGQVEERPFRACPELAEGTSVLGQPRQKWNTVPEGRAQSAFYSLAEPTRDNFALLRSPDASPAPSPTCANATPPQPTKPSSP